MVRVPVLFFLSAMPDTLILCSPVHHVLASVAMMVTPAVELVLGGDSLTAPVACLSHRWECVESVTYCHCLRLPPLPCFGALVPDYNLFTFAISPSYHCQVVDTFPLSLFPLTVGAKIFPTTL